MTDRMRIFIVICFFIICCVVGSYVDAAELSQNQKTCIELAYKHGNRVTLHGERMGETVASILWQESKGNYKVYQKNGVVVGDLDKRGRPKSLGPMQVQVPTARDLERWYPMLFKLKFGIYSPTDEELIIALLTDIEFNIQCGAQYFQWLLNRTGNYNKAILSYNRGTGGVGDPNDYVRKVKQWRKIIVLPFLRGAAG